MNQNCSVAVNITSPKSCALLKATSFGIFIYHRPWTVAYFLIGMGAQTLFVGLKRFRLTLVFMFASIAFFTTMIGLSATGNLDFLEESH